MGMICKHEDELYREAWSSVLRLCRVLMSHAFDDFVPRF